MMMMTMIAMMVMVIKIRYVTTKACTASNPIETPRAAQMETNEVKEAAMRFQMPSSTKPFRTLVAKALRSSIT